MEILFLKEIAHILYFKDYRSVIKWCSNNGVKVFTDSNFKRKYVLKLQFESARLKNIICHLKATYKENWTHVFNAIQTNDLAKYIKFEGNTLVSKTNSNYKPSGNHEQNFLSILQNETSEL